MKPKNDCSAFPVIPPENAPRYPFPESGMTLMDYFAAKAMTTLMSNPDWGGSLMHTVEDAYRIADLMIEERDK